MKRIAIMLLLCSILTVPAFVFPRANASPCCDEEESEGSSPRITLMLQKRQELGLTAEQTQKIRAVKTSLLRDNGLRVAQLNMLRPDLNGKMNAPCPDTPAVKDLLKKVSELELQMNLRKVDAFGQAYATLNSSQQAGYAALWKKQQLKNRTKK